MTFQLDSYALSASYNEVDATLLVNPIDGHARFHPMPSPDFIGAYYNGAFTRGEGAATPETEFKPELIQILSGLRDHMRHVGRFGDNFVYHDMGCGFGAGVWAMQQLGIRATGNELNQDWVNTANPFCQNGLFYGAIEEVAGRLPNEIEVYLCAHVLEHLVDPLSALRAMTSRLAPNGLIYICVPNAGSYRAGILGLNNCPYFAFPMHLHYFTPLSLETLIHAAGLDLVDMNTRPMDEPAGDDLMPVNERCARLLGGELYALAARSDNTVCLRQDGLRGQIETWRSQWRYS